MPFLGLRELDRDAFMAVHHDPAQHLVFIKRYSLNYPSVAEIEQSFQRIDRALGAISRLRTLLLVDAREAPLRNDDAFEGAFVHCHTRLTQGFKKTAVILKSATGVLQLGRLSKGYTKPMGIFTRPEDALHHLGVHIDLKQLTDP
ncbi:hypothetical protein [Sorangium sp. So ce1000]|uniref:hypothetical protein n=1 Tax=Sorangium sp. So ce1000 TaxID=3133325 RepID=UPI003F605220